MSTQPQPVSLAVINCVMLVGIAPGLVVAAYLLYSLNNDITNNQGGGIVLIFAALAAYIFACLIGGIAAICSLIISKRHALPAPIVTKAIRWCVLLTLLLPWIVMREMRLI